MNISFKDPTRGCKVGDWAIVLDGTGRLIPLWIRCLELLVWTRNAVSDCLLGQREHT